MKAPKYIISTSPRQSAETSNHSKPFLFTDTVAVLGNGEPTPPPATEVAGQETAGEESGELELIVWAFSACTLCVWVWVVQGRAGVHVVISSYGGSFQGGGGWGVGGRKGKAAFYGACMQTMILKVYHTF